jgi:predicted RecA/RadA family phage recombinase
MTATNDIRSIIKPGLGRAYSYPVLAGVVIFGGTAVGITANQEAVPAGHASVAKLLGFADQRVDNRDGETGDVYAKIEKDVRLIPIAGATVANIGATVYASADDTFTLTAGSLLAIGTIDAIDADGVWLKTI